MSAKIQKYNQYEQITTENIYIKAAKGAQKRHKGITTTQREDKAGDDDMLFAKSSFHLHLNFI